ncbi:MAG: S-layer homology domain-containing protein [Bacillota bacterium]|nr:S-layer homology domain-containing protein [Bacillota bacterium]
MNKKIIGITSLLCAVCISCSVGSTGVSAAEYTDTNHWAKNSIDYVTELGWFAGMTETTFEPKTPMTRAMFVTVLARVAEADTSQAILTSFSDVSSTHYYAPAVSWAYANDIVEGVTENTFCPDEDITREEAVTMLSRFLNNMGIELVTRNNVTIYSDEDEISDWAYDDVYAMQKYGIMVGDGKNCFNPADGFTRAEAAVVFARLDGQFLENYEVVVEEPVVETVTDNGPTGSYIGSFRTTFYCPGSCCNGSWAGSTATGAVPTPGRTIAVDPNYIKLGSYVYLEFTDARLTQYNGLYRAEDTGGAIKGYRMDVLLSSHSACLQAGVGTVNVYLQ